MSPYMRLLQEEGEQRPHKVSFYVEKVVASEIMNVLSQRLEKRGVRVHFIFFINLMARALTVSF